MPEPRMTGDRNKGLPEYNLPTSGVVMAIKTKTAGGKSARKRACHSTPFAAARARESTSTTVPRVLRRDATKGPISMRPSMEASSDVATISMAGLSQAVVHSRTASAASSAGAVRRRTTRSPSTILPSGPTACAASSSASPRGLPCDSRVSTTPKPRRISLACFKRNSWRLSESVPAYNRPPATPNKMAGNNPRNMPPANPPPTQARIPYAIWLKARPVPV